MDVTVVVVAMAALFAWGLLSHRLERADLTAPIAFIAVGAALAGLDLVDGSSDVETVTPLVEVTLVWVLFSDAARLPFQQLRRDRGRYLRLLAVGLPLTILSGWLVADWLFPGLGLWLALLVGAALAPTDAALGIPVVTNPLVPARIRQLITVESGLNDGIATPVVMLAIAGAAAAAGLEHAEGAGGAALELVLGVAVGVIVGGAGGAALRWARRHRLAAESFAGIAVLALALLSYACAIVLDGNGFVAAFCGGLAFGVFAGRRAPAELEFLEQTGTLLASLVWMAFGAIAVPITVDAIDATTVLYAVLSLTVIRMVPVAVASIGAGLDLRTILFVGWFGPRGLASLVFALLALEALGSHADEAVAILTTTVLLSVLAHGLTAAPLARRYGRSAAAAPEPRGPVSDPPAQSPA
ncbi:sodium:proton antiporter [Nocardioides sp. Soil777]|uniref:cation:proton antiporter n=1 Tax=Nocardioides sp. Soil777 TaxID=1736409 RepID=UPI0007039741|nr:cation:proton antiporter [Nocardioides sp. Soil777]KRE99288.1 sodium:proton antiporter [Nocardioides sp. Soil777]